MYGGTSELGSLSCNLRNERSASGPGPKHSLLTTIYRQQEKSAMSQGTSSFQKSLDLRKFYLAYKICTWLNHLHFAMTVYFPARYPVLLMSLTLVSQVLGKFACWKYPILSHLSPQWRLIREEKQILINIKKNHFHISWYVGMSFTHSSIHFHFCPLSSSSF